MAKNTSIEWCDHTFNPWWGCTKVSPACDNCYAAALDKRTSGNHWGAGVERRRTSEANWKQPIKWNDNHEAFFKEHGRRQRVFCASMADVFDNEVNPQWRVDLFRLIAETPHLDWLLLTKRIGNANAMLEKCAYDYAQNSAPWLNIWLGITICNQKEADRDIPKLLAAPAAKRFLSVEPMLGAIDLEQSCDIAEQTLCNGKSWKTMQDPLMCHMALRHGSTAMLNWVICGGESGAKARPMHPDWARSLRDQCNAAGVPFFFKQWGEWRETDGLKTTINHRAIGKGTHWLTKDGVLHSRDARLGIYHEYLVAKLGKKAAGRLLDGREWNEVPV